MNSLSWFIYLADVVDQIGRLLGGLGVLCGMITVLFGILTFTSMLATDPGDSKTYYGMRFTFKKYLKIFTISTFAITIVNIFIPSKNTLWLIAGSQLSEQIVETPQAKQILDKLSTVINSKLDNIVKDSR